MKQRHKARQDRVKKELIGIDTERGLITGPDRRLTETRAKPKEGDENNFATELQIFENHDELGNLHLTAKKSPKISDNVMESVNEMRETDPNQLDLGTGRVHQDDA